MRRLREWHEAGVWQQLHEALLADLYGQDKIDWEWALVDSSVVRAVHGEKTGPSPTDRRKPGSKHYAITDAEGTPFAVILTATNVNDITQLLPLREAIPAIKGRYGRPKFRPARAQGDRGYDSDTHRGLLIRRGIEPVLPRRSMNRGSGLGITRWMIERTFA